LHILYSRVISASVTPASGVSYGNLKPALTHDLTNCIAASNFALIARLLGSSRSPSSLNMRSQSQLEAGIVMISRASRAKLGYFGLNFSQYCTGLPSSRYCSVVYFGSILFQRLNSSSEASPSLLVALTKAAIASLILFAGSGRGRVVCGETGLYSAQSSWKRAFAVSSQAALSRQLLSQ
jgi:hypothetical protein